MLTIALSHLLGRGVRLETHEAVALARELLANPRGIPTPENVQLGSDGSASCISIEGTPSVASAAALLRTLLPDDAPNVPAPLRYVIARGLGLVEGPAFTSLDEFTAALKRFEKGSSRDVLKGLLQRVVHGSKATPSPMVATPAPRAPSPIGASLASRPAAVVPQRPTLVSRKPVGTSSAPPQRIAPAPTTMTSLHATAERLPAEHVTRRWGIAVAATLLASFAAGFALGDRISDRHAAITSRPARVFSGDSALAVPTDSPVNPTQVEPTDEIVRVPGRSDADGTPAFESRSEAAPNATSGGVKDLRERVIPIVTLRQANANAFSPAFASDGTAIFFHTGRDTDTSSSIEVATIGARGDAGRGIAPIVSDGSHNYHAHPSPDGRLVAFDSDRDGERGVYVANRNGSHVRRVSGAGYAAVPTWSPNNEWLAYIRAEADKPSVWNLWVQPAAGGRARRVTSYRYGQTWAASWFPDSRRIAFSHEATLNVMDLQTGRTTRYRPPVKGQLVRTPAVSPDGTKIIFQVFRHGAWLLNLADGALQRVLTDPTAEEFAWAPDGGRIAFHSRRDGRWGIYVLAQS